MAARSARRVEVANDVEEDDRRADRAREFESEVDNLDYGPSFESSSARRLDTYLKVLDLHLEPKGSLRGAE